MPNMTKHTWLQKEVREAVERKAYAHGVPKSISILIAEYASELITTLYAERSKKLVSAAFRSR
jgi:S-adenosylmethionine synthetase